MSSANRMAVLGFGNMAKALFNGAWQANACDPRLVNVFDPNIKPSAAAPFQMENSVADAIQGAHAAWICVKPDVVEAVLKEVPGKQENMVYVSIAAGVSEETIRDALQQPNAAVIRVMPNLPQLVGKGASGYYANPFVTPAQLQSVTTILNATGIAIQVDKESDLHAVTAVSGSGPAYVLRVARDVIAAGVAVGLSETVAKKLFFQTLLGTIELADASVFSLDELCEQVRSPKGTTNAALESLDRDGFDQIIKNAVTAARDRSVELGKPSGEPPAKKPERGIVSPRSGFFAATQTHLNPEEDDPQIGFRG